MGRSGGHSPSYHMLTAKAAAGDQGGVGWAVKSRLPGILPDFVVADLVGHRGFRMAVLGLDPGTKNFVGGAWRLPDRGNFQPVRVSGQYYHERVGANRARDRLERERDGGATVAKDDAGRTRLPRAKARHALELGKSQLFHELLASWRVYGDECGGGRDFMIVTERDAPTGGRGHRKPATKEFRRFLAQFVLVVTVGAAYTSQMCARCGAQMRAARTTEGRSKCCHSPSCAETLAARRTAVRANRPAGAATPTSTAKHEPAPAADAVCEPHTDTTGNTRGTSATDDPSTRHRRAIQSTQQVKNPHMDRDTSAGIVQFQILEARAHRAGETENDDNSEQDATPTAPLAVK